MKNKEKYRDEIIQAARTGKLDNLICKLIQKMLGGDCNGISCKRCHNFLYPLWLEEEYEEPEMD